MSYLVLFVILSFVVYRATRFMQMDSLLDEPRNWLKDKILGAPRVQKIDISQGLVPFDPNAKPPYALWRIKLYELATCPYCLSAHIAWMAVLVADAFISIPLPVFMWVASAAGAMAVWRYVEGE